MRLGSKGPMVERWKNFLRGLELFYGEVDGIFDTETEEATRRFQALHRLGVDGVAGNETIGRAMVAGFELVGSLDVDRSGPNWPPKPVGLTPMNQTIRQQLFGAFKYQPDPTPGNPEGIKILGDWQKDNITTVQIPQLKGVKYGPSSLRIPWNSKVTDQIVGLFAAWEKAGLLGLIQTWGGSWNPRFVRGSRTTLSNHSWATAFDINAAWNGLGVRPALVGRTGSVRELVLIAADHGFIWGGWFNRQDGMHFEICKIL